VFRPLDREFFEKLDEQRSNDLLLLGRLDLVGVVFGSRESPASPTSSSDERASRREDVTSLVEGSSEGTGERDMIWKDYSTIIVHVEVGKEEAEGGEGSLDENLAASRRRRSDPARESGN